MAGIGGPFGNDYAARGRRWRDAIEHVISRWPEDPDLKDCSQLIRGLRQSAFSFVKQMIATGDISFFKEFGDRIDGKASQSIEHTGTMTYGHIEIPVEQRESGAVGEPAGAAARSNPESLH